MQIKYSTEIIKEDWQYVIDNANLANSFHTIEYYEILADSFDPSSCSDERAKESGGLLYACAYDGDKPIGVIVGDMNDAQYYKDLVMIGSKSGGYPLLINEYEQREDSDQIKNDFINFYANEFLKDKKMIFYSCFNHKKVIFDDPEWGCMKQIDQAAFLDLTMSEEELLMNMNKKCRNMIRNAEKQGVECRIANEEQYFDLFYKFYEYIRKKRETSYMGYDELKARFDVLTKKDLADLWVAFYEDRPLAYVFVWKLKKNINFVYGSSDPEALSYKPNNILQWEIMKYYKKRGYTLYNMWGVRNMNMVEEDSHKTDRPIEGYGKFKVSFGPELRDLVRYVKV